jgi:hypothetical protein
MEKQPQTISEVIVFEDFSEPKKPPKWFDRSMENGHPKSPKNRKK